LAVLADVVAHPADDGLVDDAFLGPTFRNGAFPSEVPGRIPAGLDHRDGLDERFEPVDDLAVAVHDERAAVEHQFVLTADEVGIHQRHAGLDGAIVQHLFPAGLLVLLVGRGVDDQPDLGTRLARLRHRGRGPDVLADQQRGTGAGEVETGGRGPHVEVALLVEDLVIRKQLLAVVRLHLAVAEHDGRVEDHLALVLGVADHHVEARQALAQALQAVRDAMPEPTMEQQVLGRVAGQGQLGQQQDVRALLPRLGRRGDDARFVTGYVADEAIDLAERDAHGCATAFAWRASPWTSPWPS